MEIHVVQELAVETHCCCDKKKKLQQKVKQAWMSEETQSTWVYRYFVAPSAAPRCLSDWLRWSDSRKKSTDVITQIQNHKYQPCLK